MQVLGGLGVLIGLVLLMLIYNNIQYIYCIYIYIYIYTYDIHTYESYCVLCITYIYIFCVDTLHVYIACAHFTCLQMLIFPHIGSYSCKVECLIVYLPVTFIFVWFKIAQKRDGLLGDTQNGSNSVISWALKFDQ